MTKIGFTWVDDSPMANILEAANQWSPAGVRSLTSAETAVMLQQNLDFPHAQWFSAWFNRNLDIVGDGSDIRPSNPNTPENFIDYLGHEIRDKELPAPGGKAGVIRELGSMLFSRLGDGRWEYADLSPLQNKLILWAAWHPEKNLSGEYLDIYLRSEAHRTDLAKQNQMLALVGNTLSEDVVDSPALRLLLGRVSANRHAFGVRVKMDGSGRIDDALRVRSLMDTLGYPSVDLVLFDITSTDRQQISKSVYAERLARANAQIESIENIIAGTTFSLAGDDDLTDWIDVIKSKPGESGNGALPGWIAELPWWVRWLVAWLWRRYG